MNKSLLIKIKLAMIFMITVMMVMVIAMTWRRRIIVCNGNSDFH